jgi:hypothetical protein
MGRSAIQVLYVVSMVWIQSTVGCTKSTPVHKHSLASASRSPLSTQPTPSSPGPSTLPLRKAQVPAPSSSMAVPVPVSGTPHTPAKSTEADRLLQAGKALLDKHDFEKARTFLIQAEEKYSWDSRFAALIEQSLDLDPDYVAKPLALKKDIDLDAIKYLGGGSTITLRFYKKQQLLGAFKPDQTRKQSDFRSEIAAWRLCPLIRCGFHIPRNRHVKLTEEDFWELYHRIDLPKQSEYQKNLDDLVFQTPRHGKRWLHGTLKDWVKEYAHFPIERSKVWRPWLSLSPGSPSVVPSEKQWAIRSFSFHETRENPQEFQVFTHNLASVSERELGKQISNMLVFDYLITNWDRFSPNPAYAGANCEVHAGRLVSIDNGASFQDSPNDFVEQRLHFVERFSRQMLHAIRHLDREKTLHRLFPKPSPYDRRRFEHFWQQRKRLLAYVEKLKTRYGKSNVVYFD